MTSIEKTHWWCLHPDCLCVTDFHNSQEELKKHTLEVHIVGEETEVETDEETEVETQVETEVETDEETEVETETDEETQVETDEETEVEIDEETQVETDEETEVEIDEETQVETEVEIDMSDGLSDIGEIWKEISCKIEYLDEIELL
jgi:hypothetical protein